MDRIAIKHKQDEQMSGAAESGAGREGWADETGILWLRFNRCDARLCTRGPRLTASTRASVKEIL